MPIGLLLAIPLLALVIFVALIIVMRRRGDTDALGLGATDRAGIAFVTAIAAAVALSAITAASNAAIQAFQPGPVAVSDMTPGGAARTFDIGSLVHTTSASADVVTVVVNDAPDTLRWLLFAGSLMGPLAALALSGVTVGLGVGLLRRRPFGRALVTALWVSAIVLVVTSAANVVLGVIARAVAALHIDPHADVFIILNATIDPTPWGFAFFLALIATAFQVATRMQKDTEGLV